jgi:hypothetical protein
MHGTKRTGKLTLTGSYTFSKVLSDSSAEGDNPENPYDRHYSYGPTSFDRRQILVGTYSYQLPTGKGWNRVEKFVAGGWQFSGINRYQTGPHYTITGNTSTGVRRADYLGGDVLMQGDLRTVSSYINRAAFASAANTVRGDSGVGIVQGPGLLLWDTSLRKEFSASERIKVRFQGDVFNLLNHANFRTIDTIITDKAFGSISSAGPARNIQVGLKLQF